VKVPVVPLVMAPVYEAGTEPPPRFTIRSVRRR